MTSDHSFITVQIKVQFGRGQRSDAVRRCLWSRFDNGKFCGKPDIGIIKHLKTRACLGVHFFPRDYDFVIVTIQYCKCKARQPLEANKLGDV